VGHYGYQTRHVQLFVVGNRLNFTRLASELSVGAVGQAVRLQADRRAICAGNIALHSCRMSSDLCKLFLPKNTFKMSTMNVFAVHIPHSLGACGAFFAEVAGDFYLIIIMMIIMIINIFHHGADDYNHTSGSSARLYSLRI